MTLKIHTYPGNPRAFKSIIAARYNGLDLEVVPVEMGKDNKTPEFLAKNPLGKVPVLETPEGFVWESNAMARYVARASDKGRLYGNSIIDAGHIEQWIEFTRSNIELAAAAWLYPILGYVPNNSKATRKAKADIRFALDILNKHLATRTFLVGERVTIADIIVAMNLLRLYTTVLDPQFSRPFGNTNRWFKTLINQPHFIAVLGEVHLCEKMAAVPEEEEEEVVEEEEKPKKGGRGGKGGKGGKQQQQQQQPKKSKKKEKAEEEPAEEEEEEEKEEKKVRNPLDDLPKSKLIMDEWKRVYSNTKDMNAVMSWFWEHYDPEGYSIFFSHFKYNDECTAMFKTLNQLNGWIQRLEKLHKYAFGSLLVFGDEPKLEVSCCWLFRGTDVPQEMKDADDFPLYEWVKADHSDEATKKKIEAYWTWQGDFGGKVFNDQGKIYK